MQKVFDRAVACHNAGDAAGAQKLYRRILKAEPRNPMVLNLLGVAAFQLGRKKATVASLSKAIAIAPIYASSLGRWRRHQDHLGPLIDALGPLAEI